MTRNLHIPKHKRVVSKPRVKAASPAAPLGLIAVMMFTIALIWLTDGVF